MRSTRQPPLVSSEWVGTLARLQVFVEADS